ncbi:hypothetical protein [Kineothrix sp. MB12-C1]|uniref:hypothetical protein n=1 Tax=Kineothrix sp. MB12-C1 TaxID=3070215 RepID=UPI0027D23DC5|nr:hypothetical protein [Kineothrix sp. MB12-C1]WMC91223.1 hypothetical protein RBB56_10035 [Kineothrix sp. MB12-C1]
MKNKRETFLWVSMAILLFIITVILPILCVIYDKPLVARAEDNPYGTPFQIESTAYCYGEITASGQAVREGIAAGRKEWIGLTAIVYTDDSGEVGELIGIYEILDTGGDERIQDGRCIDIYIPDYKEAISYGRKTVWMQLVDAKG